MPPTHAAQVEERRARLLGWIDDSRRRQRRFAVFCFAGLALAVAALAVDRSSGLIALVGTTILGVVSYWVTAAHIADWRQQLEHLDRTGRVR